MGCDCAGQCLRLDRRHGLPHIAAGGDRRNDIRSRHYETRKIVGHSRRAAEPENYCGDRGGHRGIADGGLRVSGKKNAAADACSADSHANTASLMGILECGRRLHSTNMTKPTSFPAKALTRRTGGFSFLRSAALKQQTFSLEAEFQKRLPTKAAGFPGPGW